MTKTDFIGKHMLLRNFVIVFHRLITDRGIFRGGGFMALWFKGLKLSINSWICSITEYLFFMEKCI